MGRGLTILGVFGMVLFASLCWAPLDLSASSNRGAIDGLDANLLTRHQTMTLIREATAVESLWAARTAALAVVVRPEPTSPTALPEKAIPGFPAIPKDHLTDDQIAAAMKQVNLLKSQNQLIEAYDFLSNTYLSHRATKEQRIRLAHELEPLAWELMRSRTVITNGQLYDVQPGDTLGKLSRPFKVTPEFIMKVNGLHNARTIRPQQTLRFVQGPFDVLTEPAEFELTVLHQGKFVRRFSIGIGKDETPTPAGLYTVNDKQVDPIKWPDPIDRRKIAGGDPENPLGSRWIGIGLGYGLHGTNEPESIGKKASRGCIRLKNEDVEQLYDMLVEGSRVLIR